jgi:hypothetical protein
MKRTRKRSFDISFREEKQSPVFLLIGLSCLFIMFFSQSVSSCINMCEINEVSTTQGKLVDLDNLPIRGAELVVRDASEKSSGPKAYCATRRGPVVMKIKTNSKGDFNLEGLKVGSYWVTYMDPKEGESFLVDIKSLRGGKRFELGVNHWAISRCFTVDIERNESKPPGWVKPVELDQ